VLNWVPRHGDVWGSGCVDTRFLDLGTSWGWVVSFTPFPLYPQGKKAPCTQWTGDWMGSRVGLYDMGKWKFFTLPVLELGPSEELSICKWKCGLENGERNRAWGVCILLRVWDQVEGGFPSTQRYYRRFLLFIIYLAATCFGRTTIFKQKYIY
jgi:hypothetical protein